MGWEEARIEVIASLDRHNGDRTERDNRLWAELVAEVRKLVEQEKYRVLHPTMWPGRDE
jgi:hypothetical protein